MILRYRATEIFGQPVRHFAARDDLRKLGLFGETPHAQDPFDWLPFSAKAQPVFVPRNGNDVAIDLWRGGLVQFQFTPQHLFADLERREIHVIIADCALDL